METAERLAVLRAPSRIGEGLREARLAREMTVREVARRVGVSAEPDLADRAEQGEPLGQHPLVTRDGPRPLDGGPVLELDTPPGPPSAPPAAAEAPTPAQGSRPVINLEDGVTWERLTAERDAVVE